MPVHVTGMISAGKEPCTCSAISDGKERCRLAKEAAAPFVEAVASNPQVMSMVQMGLGFVPMYTGVQLINDWSTDVPELVCKLARKFGWNYESGLVSNIKPILIR